MGLIDVAASRAFVESVSGPPLWEDDNFHGTHVGGQVTTNNFLTAGVAPNVRLVAVKVLDYKGDGDLGDVISGWTEGLQLMTAGEKMRFWIPEKLAYKGERPPRGMLVFDVELISFKDGK